jgi:hypothetical protein
MELKKANRERGRERERVNSVSFKTANEEKVREDLQPEVKYLGILIAGCPGRLWLREGRGRGT